MDLDTVGRLLHIEEMLRNQPQYTNLRALVQDELRVSEKAAAAEVEKRAAEKKADAEKEAADKAAAEEKAKQAQAKPPIYPKDSGVDERSGGPSQDHPGPALNQPSSGPAQQSTAADVRRV